MLSTVRQEGKWPTVRLPSYGANQVPEVLLLIHITWQGLRLSILNLGGQRG